MSRKAGWGALLVVGLALASGCGGPSVSLDGQQENQQNGPPQPPPPPKGHDRVFRLDDPLDVSLADLLRKPRKELAALADEWLAKDQLLQQKLRTGDLAFHLTPDLRLPLVVPIFRQARYSEAAGLSLPPYLEEGKKDNAVALHLARFGDVDGALRLAGPEARELVRAYQTGKNYPVEWTRVVVLQLHVAQLRLAAGEPEGARQLIGLHKQLLEVLDPKARESLLGSILLSRGRSVLTQAAETWRKEDPKDPTQLAAQAEAALVAWGKAPQVRPLIPWGSKRSEVAALLGSPTAGYALAARPAARAFDLFALPFPDAEAEAVLAGFDASEKLADVLVVYAAPVAERYSRPAQLAQLLEDSGVPGTEVPPLPGLLQRSYHFGGQKGTVTLVPLHTEVGALVQFSLGASGPPPALPRQLGDFDLDESFEGNRVRVARNQLGTSVSVAQPRNLGPLAGPGQALAFTRATLERTRTENTVSRLTLVAENAQGLPTLVPALQPLLALGGPARVGAVEDGTGHFLTFTWLAGPTRYTLRLPQGRERAPELEILDVTPPREQAERARQVAAYDLARRAERIQAGKPQARLARTWEQVRLGMTRAEVKEVLPDGKGIRLRPLPDGLAVVFNEVPDEHPGYIPRDLYVRFGADGRVAEVRVRYTDGPPNQGGRGLARLLAGIRKTAGAPQELAGSWAHAWDGYPRRKPAPVLYRWQDDLSVLTCQRDSEGLEIAVRDCPPEHPDGLPLPAFRCLPSGPENCRLGDEKKELLARWKDTGPEFQKGLLVLSPADGPYDQILVSFAGNRAVRILARHRRKWDGNPGHEELARAVRQAWGASLAELGFPRREDNNARKEMQTWTSHDDVVRVSIFWQELRSGSPRVFTEWSVLAAR